MPYLQKIDRARNIKQSAPPQPISRLAAEALAAFTKESQTVDDVGIAKIEVHEAISNVAWAYEKLRQAIDYQDEHLLRKNAIERILRRRLVAGATAEGIAEPLVLELIRGRYLLNNSVPTTKIDEAELVINNFVYLWTHIPTQASHSEHEKLFQWYLGLLSVQLNELFAPPSRDEALVKLMFATTQPDITFAAGTLSDEEKSTQIYIAIHRTLLKSDPSIIRYHLFIRRFPEWLDPDEAAVTRLGQAFPDVRRQIEAELIHPAGELLQRLMKKYAIIFEVFDDIARKYGSAAREEMIHPDQLEEDVRQAYVGRRKTITGKITRSVIRSIVYVFLTKMVLTLLIELPVDRLFAAGAKLDYTPFLINTIFPPFLLFMIGVTIRPPGKRNEDGVIAKVKDLVYQADRRHAIVKPRKPIRRSTLFAVLYRIIYSLTFIMVFGAIIYGLTYFKFTPISTVIFLLFLTIVSFFGIRVRTLAKELVVVDQRENIFTVLFDFFSVPILQVGRWISLRVPKINIMIFFLDVIIEAPFKAFLEATEGFFGFLREKREEIY